MPSYTQRVGLSLLALTLLWLGLAAALQADRAPLLVRIPQPPPPRRRRCE